MQDQNLSVLSTTCQLRTQCKRTLVGGGAWRVGLQPAELWRAAVIVIDTDLVKCASAVVGGGNADGICTWGKVDIAL